MLCLYIIRNWTFSGAFEYAYMNICEKNNLQKRIPFPEYHILLLGMLLWKMKVSSLCQEHVSDESASK